MQQMISAEPAGSFQHTRAMLLIGASLLLRGHLVYTPVELADHR